MPTFDAHANMAYSLVVVAPSPASSGTSLTLSSGAGAIFPTAPFNCTVWPANTGPLLTNAEIVRVTDVTGDVLTIERAQEGTAARTILVGDQFANTITVKALTDIEEAIPGVTNWGQIGGVLGNQTDLQAALDAKVDAGTVVGGGLTMNAGFLLGRGPTLGVGPIAEITVGTGLDLSSGGLLTATAPAWGDIIGTLSAQTDLNTALGLKAPLASPTFSGTPAAPTAAPGTNTTQLATTAFVLANAGSGTVTSVSSANGDVTVATGTTTPVLTIVSAPKLTTARNINGVAFDGTGNITVTAAAGTLTGTALNATVVTSSLTAVGDLVTGSIGTGFVVKGVTMTLGSDAANDVYYRNSSGVLTRLANGTTGQFLAATTGSAPSWGTPSGSGTVTHTGNLTANAVVLGNGTADITVSTAFVTDGVSILTVGVAGASTSGAVIIKGKTSGSLKITLNDATAQAIVLGLAAQTTSGATIQIPDMGGVGDTFVFALKAQTLGSKTITGAVIQDGLTASGSVSNDFSGSSGTFKTSTGATTLGSSATVNGYDVRNPISPNSQNGTYSTVLADGGQSITHSSGSAHTWTIDGSVAYPVGTTITFFNNGTGVVTIAISTDSMQLAGTVTSGSRTLTGPNAIATAYKYASGQWVIMNGAGLT